MQIEIEKDDKGKPWMLLTAENEAESYRLQSLKGNLLWSNTSFSEFEKHPEQKFGLKFEIAG